MYLGSSPGPGYNLVPRSEDDHRQQTCQDVTQGDREGHLFAHARDIESDQGGRGKLSMQRV